MKKRLLSLLLTLALCLTLMPTMAWATETHDHTSWTGVTELPTEAGDYYLTDNVTLTDTWTVPTGDPVNLCLNGYVINANGGSFSVITVPEGATLNLYDCDTTLRNGYIDSATHLWTADASDTHAGQTDEYDITGGCITGGNATNGGGVSIAIGGTFNMHGGNIVGNKATTNGGGVLVNGTFNMYGGNITGNAADCGGGVYASSTVVVNLVGGTITENTATEDGGGVYDSVEACFAAGTPITMADGSRKPIETLKIGDVVRVFDHNTGTISTAKLFDLWKYPEKHSGAVTLHFSNKIDITVVYGHSFFDKAANKYVAVTRDNVDFYVGHEFYNVDGACWETLIGYDFLDGEVDTYVITSETHLNCVANGMLSNEDGFYTMLTNIFEYGDGLKINAEKKADDLKRYGLFGYEELKYVSREVYDILNLQYLNVALGKGMVTKEAFQSLGAYWAEVDPELLCDTAVQQGVDEAGETCFVATAKSVQNSNPSNPGVYLGGTIKIIDNYKQTTDDNIPSNLYVVSGKTVTLGTSADGSDGNYVLKPADGMSVGVTMGAPGAFTTDTAKSGYVEYFFSDDPAKHVGYNDENKKLELVSGTKWSALNAALGNNPLTDKNNGLFDVEDGNITLLTDFEAADGDTTLTVAGIKTLDLNGHVIDADGKLPKNDTGSVITVSSGANLTITDGSTDKYTYFDYVKDGAWMLNTTTKDNAIEISAIAGAENPTLIKIPGGVITGGNGSQAGGVYVEQGNPAGKLTMNGGNIVGNTSSTAGGGVYLQTGSKFDMNGGSIIGNEAKGTGGGVGLTSASFTMNGGKIEYNVTESSGGGVYSANGTFKMTDGEIGNNTATGYGMGGGVCIGNGTFTMTGGKISGNNATSKGGGVYYNNGTVTLGGTAQITGNTLSDGKTANNLYLNNKTVTLGTGKDDSVDKPTDDFKVGVTTQTAPTETTTVAISDASDTDCHSYFFADKAMKEDVIYNGGEGGDKKLYLAVPQIVVTKTGTNPTYGTAMSADEDFFTVEWKNFGTDPTSPKLEWKYVDEYGADTWKETAPTGITASLANEKISIATTADTPAGDYGFRVTNGEDEEIKDPNDTEEPYDQIKNPEFVCGTGTLTVEKVAIKPTVSITGWTYGETAKSPSVTGNAGNGGVTYTYKLKTAQDTEYAAGVPTDAGEYTVKAEIAAIDIYAAGSATADFTIAKRPVTLVAGSDEKNYDGLPLTCTDYTIQENTTTPGYGFVGEEGIDHVTMTSGSTITDVGSVSNVIDSIYPKVGTNRDNYDITTENGTLKVTAAEITDISVAQSGTLTYSGQPQMATVSASATTVDSQAASFTYCGTQNGEYGGDVPCFTNAGTHTVYYKVTADNHGEGSGSFTVTISKATVEAPTISSKVYTGETLTADVDCTNKPYTVKTNAGGVAVGSYDVVLTLSDTTNYKWSDSEAADKTLQFSITKASNSWTTQPAIADVTYGTAISPVGAAAFGTAAITYVGTGDTTYNSTNAPTDAGTYKATFSVAATDDCNELSADVNFTIAKRTVTLTTDDKSKIYGESDPELTSTLTGELVGTDTLKYTLSRTEGETVGAYTISAALGENPNYAVTVENVGKLTISKATPTAANFTFTAPEHRAYDGQAKTATVVFDASTGLSGMGNVTVKYARKTGTDTWDAATSEKPKNVGTYKVSISVAEGTNYSAAAELTADSWTFDIYAVSSDPTVNVPVSGDKDSVKVTATVSGSTATVKNVTAEQLDKVGTGENVTIDLSSLSKSVSGVTIPKTTLENVAKSDADGLEVKLPNGTTAVFDSTTVAAVAEQAAGSNIQLVVDKENKAEQALTAAQKETVKELNDALVLDAYFVSNGKRISDFKGGEAELTVSYPTTKPVRVWYVAEDGTKELVPSTFDGKAAKFVVTHFSHYAIEILDGSSYTSCPQDNTCVYAKFTDANTAAWYHDGVHYCVENGMMNGVSNTQFAPNGTLTRGMVVTVLARLDGVTITSTGSEWYADGQAWAVKNGISDGTNMTGNITREQLATMLYRYALLKKVDVDEITKDTNTLSHNDVFTISDWATSGMHFCIAAGVVNGDDNGNLNPHNTATRAEAATMFQRFSEKVVK